MNSWQNSSHKSCHLCCQHNCFSKNSWFHPCSQREVQKCWLALLFIPKYKHYQNLFLSIFYSYTVHYRLRRDQPTKCTEIIYFFSYLYNGFYMFRQNNAILRATIFPFWATSINMVGDKSQDIWWNLHTGVLYSELTCGSHHKKK
jgi:hypothetical protein